MYLGMLSACLSVYHVYAWCLGRPEENNRSSGNRLSGDYELPLRQSWGRSSKIGTLDVGRSLGLYSVLPALGSVRSSKLVVN